MSHTNGVNGSNGHAAPTRPLRAGVYAPMLTFFDPATENLDLPAIRKHVVRLATDGLVGLVTMGSNGEAVHMNREERRQVTETTRQALDGAGFTKFPIIVGAAEQSVRGSVELCKDAAAAGADYVLVIPPSYFRAAMNEDTLYDYFIGIADQSPLPVMLYNYPGAVAGIDMDSDFMIKLAEHRNIVGVKFTCGNNGKLTRVAAATNALTPKDNGSGFMALGGMADFTLQTMVSGGSGIISGGANVFPKVCVDVFNLYNQGKIEEAQKAQKLLSQGDWVLTKAAIPGTKAALQHYFGYGAYPRRPLQRLTEAKTKTLVDQVGPIMKKEQSL
ncbi:MAG: L-threo-3-deoxy-hexylosonate aldolase [Chaenotheca gracillima]|nr:MAG: L-threo-3-deoxy-hexylosonate aldolase [Chaenotheca gracillima]